MFEGHDTTAAALVWLLFMLGTHEDIQQRCYEEINSICGPFGDVNYEDLSKLTYLECCVKETLRLYPSAPFITRTLGRNAKIGGHELPEGTQVMLNIYLIHRDPEQWKDPEIFNPDRLI
jgi:cytochrome P450